MFNLKVNERKICTVLFTVFDLFCFALLFSFSNCIYKLLFLFRGWVLILFQSLEYIPFVYLLRKNQNIVLLRKIQVTRLNQNQQNYMKAP